MDKVTNIIVHWNCNGLKTRHHNGEIRRLIRQYNPLAICLQHTNHTLTTIDQYNLATSYTPNEKELGTAIYVHKSVSYQQIKANNYNIQTCIVKLLLDNMHITLCNMYNQPSCKYNLNTIKRTLENQDNVLLVGDFNSHSPIWDNDYNSPDQNGKIRGKLAENNSMCILNDPELKTYYSRTHSTFSSIDLSLCSCSIVDRLEWSISEDDFTSDHYPVLISVSLNNNATSIERFNTEKADWAKFNQLTNAIFPYHENQDHNKIYEELVKFITEAAKKSIPLTKSGPIKKAVPWWNEDLKFLKETKIKLKRKLSIANKKTGPIPGGGKGGILPRAPLSWGRHFPCVQNFMGRGVFCCCIQGRLVL